MTNLSSTFRFLQCPLCRGSFALSGAALVCENGHSFDISREGYVNLFNKPVQTKYDKNLFSSRRAITENGFFNPLIDKLCEIILPYLNSQLPTIHSAVIVDCGCGEGSLFSQITQNVRIPCHSGLDPESILSLPSGNINAVGIDISKDGVKLAAGKNKDISWIVADLANIPLKDKSADVILNILSPANYTEFKRCLKNGGMVLKVVPEEGYLQEIRKAFDKPQNRDENIKKLFYENFKNVKETRITQTQKIPRELKKDFLLMTPLLWSLDKEKETIDFGDELTLDVTVLTAENR